MQKRKVVQPVSYNSRLSQMKDFSIDSLRFIDNLHTTNRQLAICSKIVDELKNRQVPKSILISKLIKWSTEKEIVDLEYQKDKGKITNKGKPTTAIGHYLNLCESLSLITKFSDVYSSTRLSFVLSFFSSYGFKFKAGEKLFYAYQLLNIDADGLILILEILSKNQILNQADLQKKFSKGLQERLQYKRQYSVGSTKFNIGNKLVRVQLLWKSPEKYAEHMVAPRSEWLKILGLVNIERLKSSTVYSLTDIGREIFNLLPFIYDEGGSKDINLKWIEENFFGVIGAILPSSKVSAIDSDILDKVLEAFSNSLLNIKSSNSFRLPSLDTFLFICLYMIEYYDIRLNISELITLFKEGLDYDGKKFFLKGSGRINESYITSILL